MGNRTNEWIKRARRRLVALFGGRCWHCGGTSNLHFAHIKQTDLKGMGRGRKERYYDVLNNLDSYGLLCKESHKSFDQGLISLDDFEKTDLTLLEHMLIVNKTVFDET